MNEVAPKLGFYAAIAAFIATVAYGLAQIAQILGIVNYPLADILIYGASLCISAPFLIAILALHDIVDSPNRLWTSGALLFGVMYVTYVALMYMAQLSVVIPKSMESPSGGVLDVAPQTLFWTIDGLGYVSMGMSTLFVALSLPRAGPGMWSRRFMLANAMITPIIAFIYFYPIFRGPGVLRNQGLRGDDACAGALPRLARLRKARVHLLAGVRSERQENDHRPAAPIPPCRIVCL